MKVFPKDLVRTTKSLTWDFGPQTKWGFESFYINRCTHGWGCDYLAFLSFFYIGLETLQPDHRRHPGQHMCPQGPWPVSSVAPHLEPPPGPVASLQPFLPHHHHLHLSLESDYTAYTTHSNLIFFCVNSPSAQTHAEADTHQNRLR